MITLEERGEIARLLTGEAARLEATMREYNRSKGNVRNAAVKAMALEGERNMQERIDRLRELATRVGGGEAEL